MGNQYLKDAMESSSTHTAIASALEKSADALADMAKLASQALRSSEDYINNLENRKPNNVVCCHCGKTLHGLDLTCVTDGFVPNVVFHEFTHNATRPNDGKTVVEVSVSYDNWIDKAKSEGFAIGCVNLIHCPYCGRFPFTNKKVSLKPHVDILLYSDVKTEEEAGINKESDGCAPTGSQERT